MLPLLATQQLPQLLQHWAWQRRATQQRPLRRVRLQGWQLLGQWRTLAAGLFGEGHKWFVCSGKLHKGISIQQKATAVVTEFLLLWDEQ